MLARACSWNEREAVFRLTSSLRGMAAEFAFSQLPGDVAQHYASLRGALQTGFMVHRATSSYLAELESKKLKQGEDVAVFIADIMRLVLKGYPTADEQTRETIAVRHFLKGMPDHQATMAVGMKTPRAVGEARHAYDTYVSLHDDAPKPPRARAVGAPPEVTEAKPVTKADMQDMMSMLGDKLAQSLRGTHAAPLPKL